MIFTVLVLSVTWVAISRFSIFRVIYCGWASFFLSFVFGWIFCVFTGIFVRFCGW